MTCTGDYRILYRRFVDRNDDPGRHRGHVVNDCYSEKAPCRPVQPPSYEAFARGIASRGVDSFVANGPHIVVDTTNFESVDMASLIRRIDDCRREG